MSTEVGDESHFESDKSKVIYYEQVQSVNFNAQINMLHDYDDTREWGQYNGMKHYFNLNF